MKSVQQGSTRPVVAYNFGLVDTPWTQEEFPRSVVMRANRILKADEDANWLYNYNKLRAMVLARVKTGIMLDADQFVAPRADRLFARIKEEINEDYPYIILPVHWLSKDDDPNYPKGPYWEYDFHCTGCANRTQR